MPRPKPNENIQNSIDELKEKVQKLKEAVVAHINVIETSELNRQVFALKEIVENQSNSINATKGQIKDLKETIVYQNKVIVQLVSEVKTMLKCYVTPGLASTKYSDLFPIHSENELKQIEEDIDDESNFAMVATIKNILSPEGLNKNLANLLDIKILLDFNVDGKQEKNRFLDFPKFVNAIYQSLKTDDLFKTKFLYNLRKAFRLNKNRYCKQKCLKKQSKMNNTFLNSEDESDLENNNPGISD